MTTAMLVLALGAAPGAQAQAPPFPVPVGPDILLAPLLMVLVPWLVSQSGSDERSVRQLEAAHDWTGLAATAHRQLEKHPDDTRWRLARALALQMRGRLGEAVDDFALAFDALSAPGATDAPPDLAFATGMNLGLCQMLLSRLPEAAQTMHRLAAMAPQRWEPDYNLAAIRALQGRDDEARSALATLRAKQSALADSLAALGLSGPSTPAAPAAAAPEDAGALPAQARLQPGARTGRLPANDFSIGLHRVALPPGTWQLVAATAGTVRALGPGAWPSNQLDVPVLTGTFLALDGTRLQAALALTVNTAPGYGARSWSAGDACAGAPAILLERPVRNLDRPVCLALRLIDRPLEQAAGDLGPALQAARASGAPWPTLAYEVRYARYGLDGLVSATVLVPVRGLAGQLAAVHWAHLLAEALRPMADGPLLPVTLPPIGRP